MNNVITKVSTNEFEEHFEKKHGRQLCNNCKSAYNYKHELNSHILSNRSVPQIIQKLCNKQLWIWEVIIFQSHTATRWGTIVLKMKRKAYKKISFTKPYQKQSWRTLLDWFFNAILCRRLQFPYSQFRKCLCVTKCSQINRMYLSFYQDVWYHRTILKVESYWIDELIRIYFFYFFNKQSDIFNWPVSLKQKSQNSQ